jgi:hypothetical protein
MSDFVRSGDVKETLKIGRKANAFKLSYVNIKAEVAIPVIKETLTEKIMAKYNITGESAALLMGFGYNLPEHDLITALTILNQDGICRRLDDFIHEKIMMQIPEQIKKYPDISFDLKSDKVFAKLKWILLKKETIPNHFATIQLTFKITGLDLLYRDQLYRIAPPKDGGLEDSYNE